MIFSKLQGAGFMAKLVNNTSNNSNESPVATIKPPVTSEELVTLPIEEILNRLNTTQQGLSSEQATERLETYGRNELAREHKHSVIKRVPRPLQKPT